MTMTEIIELTKEPKAKEYRTYISKLGNSVRESNCAEDGFIAGIEWVKEIIHNEQLKTREQIIREVANYIAPYSETAAQMALEVIAK